MAQVKKPFKKILWEKQDFPDNYCGPEFMKELRENVNAKNYKFGDAVRASFLVIHQFCSVYIFIILFSFVYNEILTWSALLIGSTISAMLGYCFLLHLGWDTVSVPVVLGHLKSLAIFVGFGYGMSPVFKSLTETISTDTIYAMTSVMFLVYMVFHDYGLDAHIVTPSLSLNAAIFGTVCLISRLPSSNHVFTMLALAMEIFALWPILQTMILNTYKNSDIWLTVVMSGLVIGGFLVLSLAATLVFIGTLFFVSVVCPCVLIKMQPKRNTIHGPWDEAVIEGDRHD